MPLLRILIYTILVNSIFFSIAKAQTPDLVIEKLETLDSITHKYPQEKVYLHLDRSSYLSGDTIWLKAYVKNSRTSLPTQMSGILNVELIRGDKMEKKLVIALTEGFGWAQLPLPDTLSTGRYQIRAYTKWMRNFDSDFFFNKTLQIARLNRDAKGTTMKDTTVMDASSTENKSELDAGFRDSLDLQFFPEGGQMVNGLPSKIAFKAVNIMGMGVEVKGAVFNQNGTQVAEISDSYLGMGSFMMNPQPMESYIAKIELGNGLVKKYKLPEALSAGYTLLAKYTDTTEISVKILATPDLAGKGPLHLVAQHNGEIFYDFKIDSPEVHNSIILKTETLPSGTITLSLFGNDGLVKCERICFIDRPTNHISFSANGVSSTHHQRQKMNISLLARQFNNTVPGSFSVSVTNTSLSAPDKDSIDIVTAMQLTSELKGYIENPRQYLGQQDSLGLVRLNNLLLTQGWRKIDWNKLDQSANFEFPVEKRIEINGKVTRSKDPVVNGQVLLISSGAPFNIDETFTDSLGRFKFEPNFTDTMSFAIQGKSEKGKKFVDIELDKVLAPPIKDEKASDNGASLLGYLNKNKEAEEEWIKKGWYKYTNMLKEVKIVKEVDKTLLENIRKSGQKKIKTIIKSDLDGYTKLSDYLTQHLKLYLNSYRMPSGNFVLIIGSPRVKTIKNGTHTILNGISIFVNGLEFKGDELDAIPLTIISKVDVFYLSGLNSSATLLIRTKDNDSKWANVTRNTSRLISFEKQGYAATYTFYVPKYNIDDKNKKFDNRRTIYWSPNASIDAEGMLNLEYYNSDVPGDYLITVQGMDIKGRMGSFQYQYSIK